MEQVTSIQPYRVKQSDNQASPLQPVRTDLSLWAYIPNVDETTLVFASVVRDMANLSSHATSRTDRYST